MTRKTRFRVWDKVDQRMAAVGYIDFANQEVEIEPADLEGGSTNVTRSFSEVDLMQSTCIQDKHGITIYERDIICAVWHFTEPHVVEWPDDYYSFVESGLLDGKDIEIIGDFYRNPEMRP